MKKNLVASMNKINKKPKKCQLFCNNFVNKNGRMSKSSSASQEV